MNGYVYPKNNNFPTIDPLDDNDIQKAFKETHDKANEWEYEQEYRLTKLLYPNVPTDNERTVEIPDNFFAEIVLGLKTPDKDRQEIITIAKSKGIKVFQTVKVPFKFQLDRHEVK